MNLGPTADPGIVRLTRSALSRKMPGAGFKGKGLIFRSAPIDGVARRVAFGEATHQSDGLLRIEPSVGIIHEPLEEILADLTGNSSNLWGAVTLLTNIGYLEDAGHFRSFAIASPEVVEKVCGEAVGLSVELGEKFWRQYGSLEAILRGFQRRPPLGPTSSTDLRFPIALVLAGQTERSCEIVARRRNEVGEAVGPWFDSFRRFTGRFLNRYCS